MFSPRWQKRARDYHKAGKRFLNYKRDILKPTALGDINLCLDQLQAGIKSKDEAVCKKQQAKLDQLCSAASPTPHNAWAENLEVIFVALIIALSIKSYFVQPFIIPTGSMQPTLNGINGKAVESAEEVAWNPLRRAAEQILFGRRSVDISQKAQKQLLSITEHRFLHSVWTNLNYADGSKQKLPMPRMAFLEDFGFDVKLRDIAATQGKLLPTSNIKLNPQLPGPVTIPAGTLLARGYVTSGDVVLANRMSYHFRPPKRGEVFIFTTKGIDNLEAGANELGQDAQHYIKRLAGTPMDSLLIREGDPQLYLNGEPAQEETFQRVASQAETPHGSYTGYQVPNPRNNQAGELQITLQGREKLSEFTLTLGDAEYAALGDNSAGSLDSRSWGAVNEDNLVGAAWLSLWPFHSHFGNID